MNIIIKILIVASISAFVSIIFRGVGLDMILNPDALLVVVGGAVIAVLVGFPFERIRGVIYDVIGTFTAKRNREEIIDDIISIARIYRKADIRTLENKANKTTDSILKLGINLLINHHRSEDIKNIMEREIALRSMDHNLSQNVLKTIARLTPSLGLAGTVISLIKMFKSFQSVDAMSALMAISLMSTFYGVVISNVLVLPLYAKLKEHAIFSETLMTMTVEGIVAINNMEHPAKIEERLRGHEWITEQGLSLAGGALTAAKSAGRI